MKCLLIPLLAALALPTAVNANWFGKYNSRIEALKACENWASKGNFYISIYKDAPIRYKKYSVLKKESEQSDDYLSSKIAKDSLEEIKRRSSRYCLEEKETRQILGYGSKGIKPDFIYYENDFMVDFKYKIWKYFKY